MMDDASPPGLGWEEDEEEEPLFADDIGSDDDDPPPLPPPMPPLSQLSQQPHITTSNGRTPSTMMGGGRGGSSGGLWNGTQATSSVDGQGSGGDQDTPTQKKRAPILTLTVDRIFSEKGLPRIEKEFPKLKFKGKGYEVTDLRYLMQQYEHWANSLYPKLTFKDVTDRIEKLATKKEFKSQLIQMRRRWARVSTPPIPNDEEEDDALSNRHDNSSSDNNHPGNPSDNHCHDNRPLDPHHSHTNRLHTSPSSNIPVSSPNHTESESGMKESDHGNESDSVIGDRGRLMNGIDVDCTYSGRSPVSTRAERREEPKGETGVIVSECDGERDTRHRGEGESERIRDSEQCNEMIGDVEGDIEFEDLLMRESDILREREQTSRKRDRDSNNSPPSGSKQTQSQHSTPCGNEVTECASVKAKKPKLSKSEVDEMMDALLAEEEQLMLEASNDIPTEFDV